MKATHEGKSHTERMIRKPPIERVADMAEAVQASSMVAVRLEKATRISLMAANEQLECNMVEKRSMSETLESVSKPGLWRSHTEQTIRQQVHNLMQLH
jgi:hypothetical protein